MLTLYDSPFGITGTWDETAAHANWGALALNGTETTMPPSNQFPVSVTVHPSFLAFEVPSYGEPSFRAEPSRGGLTVWELQSNGAPFEAGFTKVNGAGYYDSLVEQVAAYCQQPSSNCGQN